MEHENNPQQLLVNNGNAGNDLNAGAAAFEPLAANHHNGGGAVRLPEFWLENPRGWFAISC
jgi:hypothetical protein